MATDLCYLSAKQLGRMLRDRDVSVVDIVGTMVERIEQLEPKISAFITVDGEGAIETARERDAELRRGQDRGPLHGIPMAVKDLYDTAGLRTTCGSKILADRVPDKDSAAVARLRAAGAVVMGKTNLNEFASGVTTTNPHYGDTHNPWKMGHVV